jgi:hypothetical protein
MKRLQKHTISPSAVALRFNGVGDAKRYTKFRTKGNTNNLMKLADLDIVADYGKVTN